MSTADLDALDRGVIDAGLTAAEVLSRVAAVETRRTALSEALCLIGHAAGRPDIARAAAAAVRADLRRVQTEDSQ